MLFVGNDIVDIRLEGVSEKWRDARFLNRVFTQTEREAILSAKMPSLIFWSLWAAKETAYKIVSRAYGPPVFAHRKFVTEPPYHWAGALSGSRKARIRTSYESANLMVEIDANADFVHAHSSLPDRQESSESRIYWKVRKITDPERAQWKVADAYSEVFTPAECESVRHPDSALARLFCKAHIAEVLRIEAKRLQIIRPSAANKPLPPSLIIDDHPAEIGISLSHHGDWVAWAFSAP